MSPTRIVKVPFGKFTEFVNRPRVQAAFAVVVICTAVVCGWLAYKSWQDAKNTARVARVNCERSQAFGPQLGQFFQQVQAKTGIDALSPEFFVLYQSTIPKRCD